MTYKALRNKSGEWVVIIDDFGPAEILTTGIPVLMSKDVTIYLLASHYDGLDFTGIEIVTLEITIKP